MFTTKSMDITFIKKFEAIHTQFSNFTALQIITENNQIFSYTYKELNTEANKIAANLKYLGIKKGEFVGVCLEKSFELYATILALFKMEIVYVPLSPMLAVTDFKYYLDDSKVKYIVTTEDLVKYYQLELEDKLKILDVKQFDKNHESFEFVSEDTWYSSPSYMIYTSGTTGRAKGVLLPNCLHRPTNSTIERTYVSSHDKCLQFSDIRVDVHLIEMAIAWSVGATLVAVNKKMDVLVDEFGKIIKNTGISFAILAPTTLKQLLENKSKEEISQFLADDLKSLTTLISATEALTVEIVERWYQRGKSERKRKIYNGFGSTEEGVGSGITANPIVNKKISIGHTQDLFTGLKAFIFKDNAYCLSGRGELVVGGIGMALGYWNQEELTKKAFLNIQDPENPLQEIRIYKTGDLVSIDDNGYFYFEGRIDRQVEIAGNRVEPEGVENKLKKHPLISAVYVKKNEQRLEAYLVLKDILKMPDPKELRNCIIGTNLSCDKNKKISFNTAEVPDKYFIVSANDLKTIQEGGNVSGSLQILKIQDESQELQCNNETERVIQKIWQELFKYSAIGIYKDFYEIGGYSLRLVQLTNKITKETSVKISPEALRPPITIASMARQVILQEAYYHSIKPIKFDENDDHPLLIFIPPLAGAANKSYKNLFESIQDRLKHKLNVYSLVLPLVNEELPSDTLQLIQKFTQDNLYEIGMFALNAIQKINVRKQPIILLGWSWGGMLAHLIAAQSGYKNITVIAMDAQIPGVLNNMDNEKFGNRLMVIIEKLLLSFKLRPSDIIEFNLQSIILANSKKEIVNLIFDQLFEKIKTIDIVEKNKLRNLLLTAQQNTLATLDYTSNKLIPKIISYIAAKEGLNECKPNTWSKFTFGKLQERIIDDADHFTLSMSSFFKTKLAEDINELINLFYIDQADFILNNNFIQRKLNFEEHDSTDKYIPIVLSNASERSTVFELIDNINKFDPKKLILIHGGNGAGKTHLSFYLEQYCWSKYFSDKSNLIPIYIPVKEIQGTIIGSVDKYLHENLFLRNKQITTLRARRALIILDGLDQSHLEYFTDPYLTNKLNTWCANVIILTRPEVLTSAVIQYYTDNIGKKNKIQVMNLKLERLDETQQQEFINRYMHVIDRMDLTETIMQFLSRYPEFSEIAGVPVYLKLLCKYAANKKDLELELCDVLEYITSEYYLHIFKHEERLLTRYKVEKFKDLCDHIMQTLAILSVFHNIDNMKINENPLENWSENSKKDPIDWKYFFRKEIKDNVIYKALPFEMHAYPDFKIPKIFQSYFAGKYIINRAILNDFSLDPFLKKYDINLLAILNKSNPLLFKLLSYFSSKEPNLETILFKFLNATKENNCDTISIYKASCAIRLLNILKVSFSNLDLSGIKIEDVNLSKAIFSGTNLDNSFISNVILTGAKLDSLQMDKSEFEKIQVGFQLFNINLETQQIIYNVRNNSFILANQCEFALFALNKQHITHHWSNPEGYITGLTLSPSGYFILSLDSMGNINIWNSSNGSLINRWFAHSSIANHISYFENQIMTISDKTVYLWDPRTGTCLTQSKFLDGLNKFVLGKNQNEIFYVNNQSLKKYSLVSEKIEVVLNLKCAVKNWMISTAIEDFVCITSDNILEHWSIKNEKMTFSLKLATEPEFISYINDDQQVIISYSAHQLMTIDSLSGQVKILLKPFYNKIQACSYINKLNKIAIIDCNRRFFLFENTPENFTEFLNNDLVLLTADEQLKLFCYKNKTEIFIEKNNILSKYITAEPIKQGFIDNKNIILISKTQLIIANIENKLKIIFQKKFDKDIQFADYLANKHVVYLLIENEFLIFNTITHNLNKLELNSDLKDSQVSKIATSSQYLAILTNKDLQVITLTEPSKKYIFTGILNSMLFIKDHILIASLGQQTLAWDFNKGQILDNYSQVHTTKINCLARSDTHWALGDDQGQIMIWNDYNKETPEILSCSRAGIKRLFFSNQTLYAIYIDNSYNRWTFQKINTTLYKWTLVESTSNEFHADNIKDYKLVDNQLSSILPFFKVKNENDHRKATMTCLQVSNLTPYTNKLEYNTELALSIFNEKIKTKAITPMPSPLIRKNKSLDLEFIEDTSDPNAEFFAVIQQLIDQYGEENAGLILKKFMTDRGLNVDEEEFDKILNAFKLKKI